MTVEAGRGGFKEWRRKDRTQKGVPTGVDRDASDVKGGERGATGRGRRRQKRSCGVGLHGTRGT